MQSLGLIYDALYDEWVLELMASNVGMTSLQKPFSSNSSIESTPSSKCSHDTTSPSRYESCSDDSPNSFPLLPSVLQSSLSSSDDNDRSSKGKKSSAKRWSSSSNSCMGPNLVHMVMCHGHGKLWHVVKSGCMACFKSNTNKKQNKCKKVNNNNNDNNSHVFVHKRNGSAEVREQDLKEAILFCNKSAATQTDLLDD